MSYSLKSRPVAWLALLGLLVLVGCSDSDPGAPGGDGPEPDLTAPLVVTISPTDLDNGVALTGEIEVVFNEPMDQGSFAAALSLSSGAVESIAWNAAGTAATVSHSTWVEGVTVTVTVGAGATDLAGNSLPRDFTSTFYTYSSVPAMVGHDFFGPADAVPPVGYIELDFSEEMDIGSLLTAYTLTVDPGKAEAVPGVIMGTIAGDFHRISVRWDGQLTPLRTYHFSLSTAARTRAGQNLAEGFTLDFTAGSEVDTTAPYIESTVPALDAVVDPNLETIVITFNEPIDEAYRTPDQLSALLEIFMAREPVWSAAGDEITVYLSGPLPAGIRFYAVWDVSNLHDIAGNVSTDADSLSFTTSGEATLFPVREDLRWYYYYAEDGKSIGPTVRQTIENIDGDDFERVLNRQTATGFDEPMERWYMSTAGNDLMFRGFREGQTDQMFTPAVTYLPGPVPATWSGTVTMATGDGVVTLNYTGTFLETFRMRFSFGDKSIASAYLDNCVSVSLSHEMIPNGATSPVEDGTDEIYYCPGLGVISLESVGRTLEDGTVVATWGEELGLMGAALDDRYEP